MAKQTEVDFTKIMAGGGFTHRLASATAYTGAYGSVLGIFPTDIGATFSVLSDEKGNDLRAQMGLTTAMDGQAPLITWKTPFKNITCSVECMLIIGNAE